MDLAHQHIAAELNRAAEDARAMDDMEREATPLFLAVLFILAGLVLGVPLYFAGQKSTMKECLPVNHGERLIYSEQRADGTTLCNYSSGWNLYGRTKVSRVAK